MQISDLIAVALEREITVLCYSTLQGYYFKGGGPKKLRTGWKDFQTNKFQLLAKKAKLGYWMGGSGGGLTKDRTFPTYVGPPPLELQRIEMA